MAQVIDHLPIQGFQRLFGRLKSSQFPVEGSCRTGDFCKVPICASLPSVLARLDAPPDAVDADLDGSKFFFEQVSLTFQRTGVYRSLVIKSSDHL